MRKIFVDQILKIMESDPNVIFLTGDLGYGSFEILQEKFPTRFYNMGIAEQNMVGVACGLSLENKKVIVYSIANFSTLRVLEQIRNYLIYHDSKVLIVNGGGGFCYGQLGYTHHSLEDIAILKALPHIKLYAPYNIKGIAYSINNWYHNDSVSYLRLEKNIVEIDNKSNTIEQNIEIIGISKKNIIITYGTIVEEAVELYHQLPNDITVIILTEIKNPCHLPYTILENADVLIVLEEGVKNGGLGEQIISQIMMKKISINKIHHLGVADKIFDTIGDQKYMRTLHNLTTSNIKHLIKK
jgi:transketolase